ncbi:hypothetical protein BDZ91DRAFT_804384 [Kalaharituber pfeilii]|nr:hypothetical protein BDZ91DRAFT_804384 [Kalaharituber pfeilii]
MSAFLFSTSPSKKTWAAVAATPLPPSPSLSSNAATLGGSSSFSSSFQDRPMPALASSSVGFDQESNSNGRIPLPPSPPRAPRAMWGFEGAPGSFTLKEDARDRGKGARRSPVNGYKVEKKKSPPRTQRKKNILSEIQQFENGHYLKLAQMAKQNSNPTVDLLWGFRTERTSTTNMILLNEELKTILENKKWKSEYIKEILQDLAYSYPYMYPIKSGEKWTVKNSWLLRWDGGQAVWRRHKNNTKTN